MAVKVEPAYIGQAGYDHPVELDRNLLEGIFGRSGAFRYGDFALSQGVGTRAIAVAPGRYFILGTENATQGGYFVWSDGAETKLLASVATSRYDTFLLQVYDDQYGTISGLPRAEIRVVQGVASGSPTILPDSSFNVGGPNYQPGAWFRLGDVRVNAADTGSIPTGQIANNMRHVRWPSAGGAVICTPSTRPSDPLWGDTIHELVDVSNAIHIVRRWNGTEWVMVEPYTRKNVISVATSTVTFSNIPTTLRTLVAKWTARSTQALDTTEIVMRVNANTGANYYVIVRQVNNATQAIANTTAGTSAKVGQITAANVGSIYGIGEVRLNGWNLTGIDRINFNSTFSTYPTQAASYLGESGGVAIVAPPWTSLSLIAAFGNFAVGSEFTLEGWE